MQPNSNSREFQTPSRVEYTPQPQEVEPAISMPETQTGRQVERGEDVAGAATVAVDVASIALPVLPQPVPAAQTSDSSSILSDVPAVANDDDLIEKEWVDKAKKIIEDTKDDPYKREQAVSQLQKEYLFKRYGKELGTVD